MYLRTCAYAWIAMGFATSSVQGDKLPLFINVTTPSHSPVQKVGVTLDILTPVLKDLGDPTQPLPIPPLTTPNALSALLPALNTLRSTDVVTCWPCDWPSTAVIPGIGAPTSEPSSATQITTGAPSASQSSQHSSISTPSSTFLPTSTRTSESTLPPSTSVTTPSTLNPTETSNVVTTFSSSELPSSFSTIITTSSSDFPIESNSHGPSASGDAASSWPPPDWVAPAPTANRAVSTHQGDCALAGLGLFVALALKAL